MNFGNDDFKVWGDSEVPELRGFGAWGCLEGFRV